MILNQKSTFPGNAVNTAQSVTDLDFFAALGGGGAFIFVQGG
jgi:hypothetical protein